MKKLVIALGVILTLNVIQAVSFVLNIRSLASSHILSSTTENTISLTDSISRQFRAWNNLAEDTAVGIVPLISGNEIDADAIKKYLIAMAENKDDVVSLYVGSTVSRNAPGGYIITNNFSVDGFPDTPPYEHTTWEYFVWAMESPGTPVYFGPYFDLITGKLMISMGYAVEDKEGANGKILGCVMIDLLLDRLVDIINSKDKMIEYRETFLITRTGEFVSDQNATRRQEGDPTYVDMKDFFAVKGLEAYREAVLGKDIFSQLGKDVLIYSAYIPAADWILVSIIPTEKIFADANDRIIKNSITCALIIIVNIGLGLVMMRIIRQDRAKLVEMKNVAEAASKYKSDFLINMSHEIRTPLNAIIGMSELALYDSAGPNLREYLANIRQAGSNLLSIINDVLDLSKIESGGLQLVIVSYRFSSLINNVINVIRVRFHEKPILFLANIDPHIPDNLMGDEVRVRQILFNMLSNAVKYTEEGFIKFTVTGTITDERYITLKFEVADSGIGIKEEDMKNLFGNFTRLDLKRNQGIEGTGLGLAITKRLCYEMGGDIAVSSVYGKGSAFTALIPQEYTAATETAIVENPREKAALLYDERPLYGDSVSATLKALGVPVTRTDSGEAFLAALEKDGFPFAFVSPGMAKQAADLVRDTQKRTMLVLLADMEEIASFQGIPVILMPAYTIPVANVLNGVTVRQGRKKSLVRFTAPGVRVLIVDDIMTNLKVAQGLLAPYRVQVDICDNGRSSVSMVKANRYDIIFMDHMMPGMDGIETMTQIRALGGDYFKQVPIIALTANALSGMEEMFLSRGFNGYLAKPIDIPKLNALMEKWIPREQRVIAEEESDPEEDEAVFSGKRIEGIDIPKGLERYKNDHVYLEILRSYAASIPEFLGALRNVTPENLGAYAITVHGIKGSSYQICADETAKQAEALEQAAKAGDWKTIEKNNGSFIERLETLLAAMEELLAPAQNGEDKPRRPAPDRELLAVLLEACKGYNVATMEDALGELEKYSYESGEDLIIWLRRQLDNFDYELIQERLKNL